MYYLFLLDICSHYAMRFEALAMARSKMPLYGVETVYFQNKSLSIGLLRSCRSYIECAALCTAETECDTFHYTKLSGCSVVNGTGLVGESMADGMAVSFELTVQSGRYFVSS